MSIAKKMKNEIQLSVADGLRFAPPLHSKLLVGIRLRPAFSYFVPPFSCMV